MKDWTAGLVSWVFFCGLVSGCVFHPAGGSAARQRPAPTMDDASARIPGAVELELKPGTTGTQLRILGQRLGLNLRFNSVEGTEDEVAVAQNVEDVDRALAALRAEPLVTLAEPEVRLHADFTPNDPDFAKQWNLKLIHMPQAWDRSRGKGVILAVLDTGIAYEDYHDFRQVPDLKGVRFAPGYNFVDHTTHPDDDHRHGTHVAGTIAQATDNGEGVAGIAFEATLMPVKVLDHFGMGTSADIADGIRWATDHGAKVINMSLGGGGRSQVLQDAVAYAHGHGVTLVAAAGNSGQGRVEYPAAYPGVIAVGAVGPSGVRAPYSAFGDQLDLMAPGGDKTQGPEGGILQNTIDARDPARSVYEAFQGTSMATPHVAAVAALLYAAGAQTPQEVEQELLEGAHAAGARWNPEYGYGLLDAERSLRILQARRLASPASLAPFALGIGLLALALVSLRRRARPGLLNVLFLPRFFVPFVLATVGLFFLRGFLARWTGVTATVADLAAIPIPDWQRLLWSQAPKANPLFYSALIPLVVSALGIAARPARPLVAGLSLGFAGFLAYAGWSSAPALSYLTIPLLAQVWLWGNTLLCVLVARAMLDREAAR